MTHLMRPALALLLLLPLTSSGADPDRFEADPTARRPSLPKPAYGAVWAPDPAKAEFRAGDVATMWSPRGARLVGVPKHTRDLNVTTKDPTEEGLDRTRRMAAVGKYVYLDVGTRVRVVERREAMLRTDGAAFCEVEVLNGQYAGQLAATWEKDIASLIEVDDDDPATERMKIEDAPVDAPPVLGYPPIGGNAAEVLRKVAVKDLELTHPEAATRYEKLIARLRLRLDEPTRRRIYAEHYRALFFSPYQAKLNGSSEDTEFAVNRREIIARYRVDPADLAAISIEGQLAGWPLPQIPALSDEEASASYRIVPPPPAKKKATTPKAKAKP
jgi:hypothetical protein